MITSFVLQNETTYEKATFGMTVECDYVYKAGGVDWGGVPADHSTYTYPRQVGVSISSTKIKERDIAIEGYAYYVMSKEEMASVPREEWKKYCYDKIKLKKKQLNDLINPDDFIKLSMAGYYIEGKPTSSPIYGKEIQDNNEYFCKFMFNIYCANPMFKKDTIVRTVISGDTGVFHFPLIFPPKIIMGTRIDYLMLAVENEGNVPVGGKIIFTAKGEVKNPSVENVLTGETIKIMKTLQPGEVVTVNTVNGVGRGIIGYYHGVTMSYLDYWSWKNSWFMFQKGVTMIGYATENDAENLLDITIELNPEKYGLEEM